MKSASHTVQAQDFVELHDEMPDSPLWNNDLAPATIRQRTWSTWNIAALWIGMSVVITTYTLAGGFIEAGMNWWQAMITILLGNTMLIYGEAIPNPVDLIGRFDSVLVIAFAMTVIFVAQLTTNMAANVVSPSNDFSNLNPRLISYVTGGLITAVISVLMMPWKLMESMGAYIFTWLIGYSGLMGAIAGILICDYWILRRQQLDLAALFDPKGKYSYSHGVNWQAIVSLVLAIAPVVPGFLRAAATPGGQAAMPAVFDTLYTYAWFVTFGLGFVLHWSLSRTGDL